jgi:hypothetical protein
MRASRRALLRRGALQIQHYDIPVLICRRRVTRRFIVKPEFLPATSELPVTDDHRMEYPSQPLALNASGPWHLPMIRAAEDIREQIY